MAAIERKETDLEKLKLYWLFSEWAGLYMKGLHWSYLSTDILMIPRYGGAAYRSPRSKPLKIP